MTIALIFLFLIIPLSVSFLTQRYKILNKIGSVLICYALGLVLGHTALFNPSTFNLQDNVASASILLALPILLFDANPKRWKDAAGVTFKSMIIAIVILIVVVATGHTIFASQLKDGWKIGGMLVGIYTGGTPNLASIKTALNVSNDVYIGVHTIDTVLGAFYLFFLMTLGKSWFRRILIHVPHTETDEINIQDRQLTLKAWLINFNHKYAAMAIGVSILIAGISAGIGLLLPESYQMTVIILLITTLSLSVSMTKIANRLKSSFPVGLYFINVFSFAVATRANLYEITQMGDTLFYYVSFVLFTTFALHFIASYWAKIDADTMMITSTALICSPPFVPVIAGTLKNKSLILPGLTVGIIGYALGNYLGVIFAYILK